MRKLFLKIGLYIALVTFLFPTSAVFATSDTTVQKEGTFKYSENEKINNLVLQIIPQLLEYRTTFTIQGLEIPFDEMNEDLKEAIMKLYADDSTDVFVNIENITWEYRGNNQIADTVTVTAKYHEGTSLDSKNRVDQYIDQFIQEKNIMALSDEQKVKAIHDEIVTRRDYTHGTNRISGGYSVYSPEAIVLGEGGVCESYAKLFFLMAKKAGLPVRFVSGNASEAHTWNMVQVDGNWYHIDTTFDDPINSPNLIVSYQYYLVSDDKMYSDGRTIDENPVQPLPKAPENFPHSYYTVYDFDKITEGAPKIIFHKDTGTDGLGAFVTEELRKNTENFYVILVGDYSNEEREQIKKEIQQIGKMKTTRYSYWWDYDENNYVIEYTTWEKYPAHE